MHEVAAWFADREELYRGGGAVGPRTASHGDAQGDLLAGFGRDPGWGPNHAALARFSAAFGRGDVDAIMALMTDDCVFEATGPAPDGVRHEGAEAVRAVWERAVRADPRRRRSPRRSRSSAATAACCAGGSTGPTTPGRPATCAASTSCGSATAGSAEKLSYVKG